ncbi:sigma-E processing peptidase SpoIIGA [Blautia sp. MSJ-19]|uniref:sigma-E processing peptidase SpoIIGA n=1 Tax=Blautia sp. MSJ-19 TaxID=2841517 RepID=UPI001C0EDCC5|nr:sigma-E processing peptidase SpoIIGA [Blautia sp. MSJ-19]MBU5479629.1 sigma-E processing peptidase SpoIIGA [Blautia sp. MSJ-19]
MYQEVYIDAVFAANLLMDYILLRLAGIILQYQGSRRRCLAAAAAGAVFSSLSLYAPMEMPVVSAGIQAICAAGMLWIAYRIHGWRQLTGAVALFYGMTFLTGGFWTALCRRGNMTLLVFILCAAGTYVFLSLVIFLAERTKRSREHLYPVLLKYQGKEYTTYGLYDTGNLLVDSVTETPVSVVDSEVLKNLLPEELAEKLRYLQEKPEELKSTEIADLKPHYLSFRTVGREMQMFLTVTIEDLCIQTPGERIHISEPVLAVSSEPFAFGKEYKVILNSRLLH